MAVENAVIVHIIAVISAEILLIGDHSQIVYLGLNSLIAPLERIAAVLPVLGVLKDVHTANVVSLSDELQHLVYAFVYVDACV